MGPGPAQTLPFSSPAVTVTIAYPRGMARLSWRGWLVTQRKIAKWGITDAPWKPISELPNTLHLYRRFG